MHHVSQGYVFTAIMAQLALKGLRLSHEYVTCMKSSGEHDVFNEGNKTVELIKVLFFELRLAQFGRHVRDGQQALMGSQ